MSMNRILYLWRPLLTLALILASVACADQELPPVDPYDVPSAKGPEADELPPAARQDHFLTQLSFVPGDADYFELVKQTFSFTPDELALLEQKGFFVSDRLAFTDFTTAYAYIYWKDLPVLVTTDSILHSIHQSYDDLLSLLERTVFIPKLTALLSHSQQQLWASVNGDPASSALYTDLDTYLAVPLALLTAQETSSHAAPETETYLRLAKAADTVAPVQLFGGARTIDFTLFKPRGHYVEHEELGRYFRAMSWLAQIDFRLVEYDQRDQPRLNVEHVAAATMLREAIDEAGQRSTWEELDALFSVFVGRSDNVTLPDLDRLLADAGVSTPGELVRHPDPAQLLALLTSNDYGQQRITGQVLHSASARPISFMLMGQRFTVDAYLMSNLVYDRLLVDGHKVQRPLPSPLDVMYALGNDRALTHLQGELAQYGYWPNLSTLRAAVDDYDAAFWSGNFYNRWLGALRELDADSTGAAYPQTMRTSAWADKMLHTQLASWAQLRHDNILYVKQSGTSRPVCEYPAGYVEPYPEFYAAIRDYAQAGQALFEYLDPGGFTESGQAVHQAAVVYFDNLESIAGQLQTLAEKELKQKPFSAEEERFLKSIAIRQLETVRRGCAVVTEEQWSGWYLDLFPWRDESPVLIADVHTNLNSDPSFPALYPPSVLHVATGPVATMVFIGDTDEGPTMYVGPAFTYYEVVEEGFPPVRLTDEDWVRRLESDPRPTPPGWTGSFRVPVLGRPWVLSLPGR